MICCLFMRRLTRGAPFPATREELRLDLERIGACRERDR